VYDPTDTLRTSNPYNIEYRPQGDTAATLAEAQRFFSNLVTTELRLRRLHLYGNMEERRIRLEKLLIVEQKIDLISQAVLRGDEGKEAAMLLISQAIPCILHLENRVERSWLQFFWQWLQTSINRGVTVEHLPVLQTLFKISSILGF